ncbi:hypothetical protein SARC_09379 [Sphaeroforma arctica JP610]|uniref:non-specific serine/threonine protein kinase n=1 Tax=Sphaeroforma arctica JP610 TaxID=667725 RepID=A0A0L0FQA6_9EUKA|nr:hypothetical protein SARC_09379 [Sphaeroforma arctica JP610]KNC78183.1 hypothetical protein SARC_09379 [Sphaeroforma arctica JP610]|eukprot:XP_014152085.1 hypothetical protein SARC_09379 [Sphaeroforma arctica JP610]
MIADRQKLDDGSPSSTSESATTDANGAMKVRGVPQEAQRRSDSGVQSNANPTRTQATEKPEHKTGKSNPINAPERTQGVSGTHTNTSSSDSFVRHGGARPLVPGSTQSGSRTYTHTTPTATINCRGSGSTHRKGTLGDLAGKVGGLAHGNGGVGISGLGAPKSNDSSGNSSYHGLELDSAGEPDEEVGAMGDGNTLVPHAMLVPQNMLVPQTMLISQNRLVPVAIDTHATGSSSSPGTSTNTDNNTHKQSNGTSRQTSTEARDGAVGSLGIANKGSEGEMQLPGVVQSVSAGTVGVGAAGGDEDADAELVQEDYEASSIKSCRSGHPETPNMPMTPYTPSAAILITMDRSPKLAPVKEAVHEKAKKTLSGTSLGFRAKKKRNRDSQIKKTLSASSHRSTTSTETTSPRRFSLDVAKSALSFFKPARSKDKDAKKKEKGGSEDKDDGKKLGRQSSRKRLEQDIMAAAVMEGTPRATEPNLRARAVTATSATTPTPTHSHANILVKSPTNFTQLTHSSEGRQLLGLAAGMSTDSAMQIQSQSAGATPLPEGIVERAAMWGLPQPPAHAHTTTHGQDEGTAQANSAAGKQGTSEEKRGPPTSREVNPELGEIRTIKGWFSFNSATTSRLPAHEVLAECVRVLNANGIEYEQKGFVITAWQDKTQKKGVRVEFETCHISRLSMVGLHLKRLGGDVWQYKKFANELVSQMHL